MINEDIEIDEIEEELFGDKEDGLTGFDRRDLKTMVRDFNKSKNKKKIKEKIQKAKQEFNTNNMEKVSLSDSESRIMKNAKSYTEPSYNAQISVSKNQIIMANDVKFLFTNYMVLN